MWRTEQDLKRENERLRNELEYQRDETERRQSQERRRRDEERQARRAEYQERMREWQCEAVDWAEAFEKAIPRIRIEVTSEAETNRALAGEPEFKPSDFFARWLTEVERAQALYQQEMDPVERQVNFLRQQARGRIADRLVEEFGQQSDTAEAIREDNHEFLVKW